MPRAARAFVLLLLACSADPATPSVFVWNLPAHFPQPLVPEDNPMSAVKVELGRHLFHDRNLSSGRNQACSSCHQQLLGFTDLRVTSIGSTFETHPRNAQGLTNVAYAATLTWANPDVTQLEQQALIPIFGTEPVELALHGMEDMLVQRLRDEPRYQSLFPQAFPLDADPFSIDNLARALAAFQRTLIGGNSAYDRFAYGNEADALTDSAQRGMELFNSDRLKCSECHSGVLLQDAITYVEADAQQPLFHNTGLYNIDGNGAYPPVNTGVHAVTQRAEDMGRFRTPGLRNVALTPPYMHDGSITSLSQVLDHYAAGGRTIETGLYAGNGNASPLKSELLTGFTLSDSERGDLLAFLQSLNDPTFTEARFSDPWSSPCELCEMSR